MALAKSVRIPRQPKALEPATRLTMTFRELQIEGKRGWRHCWTFAKFAAESGDEDMQKVIECYEALKPKERQTVTPEYVCDLSGVNPNDFAAEVFREYLRYSGDAANLIEAASRPEIVRRSVQIAKTKDGHRDRKMLFEHSGFLPPKTGGGIHVNATANSNNRSATFVQAPELPSMESDTLRFTRVLKNTDVVTIEGASGAQSVKALI